MQVSWKGVFPAATTQFAADLSVDIGETQRVQDALVRDGVHGLIIMGTVGENNSLDAAEKRSVLKAAVEAVSGRAPVIAGVSELDTPRAAAFARDAEEIGADGLMVLPAMVYVPTEAELVAHFRAVSEATALPIMLYNNPPAYRVSISIAALEKLADREHGGEDRVHRGRTNQRVADGVQEDGEKSSALVSMCRRFGADEFIFGAQGRGYADVEEFERAGVSVRFQDYRPVEYPQIHGGAFVPYLSILDLLFNVGRQDALVVIRAGHRDTA